MTWVLLAIVVVLLIVIGVLVARQQRSQRLKDEFGPEYGRVVAERGDQRTAEKELAGRRQRVDKFEIRPFDPATRERYLEQWGAAQRYFVDEPADAVGQADESCRRVMNDRGYPVDEDFEHRSADISVEHPVVVENYRAAHQISARARGGQASTEQLRQAMVHFRALFDDRLAPGDAASQIIPPPLSARAMTLGRGSSTQHDAERMTMERNEETLSTRDLASPNEPVGGGTDRRRTTRGNGAAPEEQTGVYDQHPEEELRLPVGEESQRAGAERTGDPGR